MSRFLICLILACSTAWAQSTTNAHFRSLEIDAGKVVGTIHSLQGMNGTPTPIMAGLPDLMQQYKDLRVDQVRTHDVMGPTEIDSKYEINNPLLTWLIPDTAQRAAVVKAGNAAIIFPDPKADPEKPASYNFGPTDKVIAEILASGAEVYYRIGRSWGANDNPPDDFDEYANVVKHIAMHYNQGWANGFHDNIRYWEFWNEPEALFWSGTPVQFYSLYEKTARALKSVDPALKVGGAGIAFSANDGPFRDGFMDYCAAHKVALDFFSWHSYSGSSADPYDASRLAQQIRSALDAHGFPKAESILSEWNLSANFADNEKAELQGEHNAAFIGAALSYLQDAPLDHAHFYRGDAAWMGLFDAHGQPFKAAAAFKAMGKMLDTPQRFAVDGTDTFGFAALAGRSADGKTVQILISNYAIPDGFQPKHAPFISELNKFMPPDAHTFKSLPKRTNIVYRDNAGYNLVINNLPWGKGAFAVQRYRISKLKNLELVEEKSSDGGSLKLSNAMPVDTVELIVLQQK